MRRTMEDKSIIVQDLVVPELSLDNHHSPHARGLCPQTWVGVYDGHGGTQASQYLWDELHGFVKASLSRIAPRLLATPSSDTESRDAIVRSALSEAFLSADEDFIANAGQVQAGSTATTALVLGERVYCANVGDSRTVLCRNGQAVPLSNDHKPTREDEAARIKAAGGFIIHKRVMGELAVSRAFGDAEFKKGISEILGDEAASVSSSGRPGSSSEPDLSKPLIVAEPEIMAVSLEPGNDDFLLLACDGLYDVLSNQEACDLILSEMSRHGDVQRAAETLSRHAIDDCGSRDNVTILIVLLRAFDQ